MKKYLDTLPNCWHMRLPAVLNGLPDRIACLNGRFVALEIKASSDAKRAPLQAYVLGLIERAGGYAKFVYPENLDEVKVDLEKIANERIN